MTKHIVRALPGAILSALLVASLQVPVSAADREHQQMMADLRMLQEQSQQLQALLNGLGEALKAVRWKSPHRLSLRDCDRDLYCRSGARLEDDIRRGFPRGKFNPPPPPLLHSHRRGNSLTPSNLCQISHCWVVSARCVQ